MTRWLAPTAFFIFVLLFLIPLVTALDVGKYRESFKNAKIGLKNISKNLSSMKEVNASVVEELRGNVSSLKSKLNITDVEIAKERVEVEKKTIGAVRNDISKVESLDKEVLLAVFGTFGVLTGFWGVFFIHTILSYRRQR